MGHWEAIKQLKELSTTLTTGGAAALPEELARLLSLLTLIVETQQHDLQVMKATVARLEHHIRHKQILQ